MITANFPPFVDSHQTVADACKGGDEAQVAEAIMRLLNRDEIAWNAIRRLAEEGCLMARDRRATAV